MKDTLSRITGLVGELDLTAEQRTKIEAFNRRFAAEAQPALAKIQQEMDTTWKALEEARASNDETATNDLSRQYQEQQDILTNFCKQAEPSYLNGGLAKYLSQKQFNQVMRKLGKPSEGAIDADFPPGYKLPD